MEHIRVKMICKRSARMPHNKAESWRRMVKALHLMTKQWADVMVNPRRLSVTSCGVPPATYVCICLYLADIWMQHIICNDICCICHCMHCYTLWGAASPAALLCHNPRFSWRVVQACARQPLHRSRYLF